MTNRKAGGQHLPGTGSAVMAQGCPFRCQPPPSSLSLLLPVQGISKFRKTVVTGKGYVAEPVRSA